MAPGFELIAQGQRQRRARMFQATAIARAKFLIGQSRRCGAATEHRVLLSASLEGPSDAALCLRLNLSQMIFAAKALSIDLVDIFGA